jgi:hypothetical protein
MAVTSPSPAFRFDGPFASGFYHSSDWTVGNTVIPSIIVAKLSRPRPVGDPDLPGPPTTISLPCASVSICPSTTFAALHIAVFDEIDFSSQGNRGRVFAGHRLLQSIDD